jgi:hypothetical protein
MSGIKGLRSDRDDSTSRFENWGETRTEWLSREWRTRVRRQRLRYSKEEVATTGSQDARDTAYPFDAAWVDKVERLNRTDSRAAEVDFASAARLGAALGDLELEPVEGAKELDCREEEGPDEVDSERLAAGRDALKRQLEVLLAPGRELREGLEEPADGPRERDVVRVDPTEEDSWPEEERGTGVRDLEVGAVRQLAQQAEEADLVV